MAQETQTGALYQPRGVGWGGRWEGRSKGRRYGSEVKASACNVGDPGLIPKSGRSPGEGNGNHSSTLAWKIPWTEEPGGLQSTASQRVGHD